MTSTSRHSEAAFETVIEQHLLAHGHVAVPRDAFDRGRAIFPAIVLDFIKDTPSPRSARSSKRYTDPRPASRSSRTAASGWMQRLTRDAAPRLQVLRAHAARGRLQGGARTEPGARGALCEESPGAHPPAPLLSAFREVAGRHTQCERHHHRDARVEERDDRVSQVAGQSSGGPCRSQPPDLSDRRAAPSPAIFSEDARGSPSCSEAAMSPLSTVGCGVGSAA